MSQPIIIALSGRKGAGKNTLALTMRDLFCSGSCQFSGSVEEYSFADLLKQFCIEVLGLQHSQCYGSDADKETPTRYYWRNTPYRDSHPEWMSVMTGRDVMQIFGTECVRTWFGNVWAEATIRRIQQSKASLALITDSRFPNEVEVLLNYPKGYVIRLTRSPFKNLDQHASEVALDGYDWNRQRCYVLDNANMSIAEQNEAIIPIFNNIIGR